MKNTKAYVIPEDESMIASEPAVAYSSIPDPERGKEWVRTVKSCAFTDSQLRDVVAYSLQEMNNGNYYTAEQAAAHFMNL